MNDIRKLLDIINETTAGATASGAVPTVEQSMHTQRRVEEDYTEESSDKPQMPQILEYGNWENSALTTSKKLKKSRKKASKIVKSVYGEDMPGEKKEVTEGSQLARTARKIIPGLGRMQAKMRADHEREQGRLAMRELPGRERKETEPDDEYWSTRAMGNRHYDRAKKFDKIASGVDENVAEGQSGKPIKPGATFKFPNHWNKADVVHEFLWKKNAVVDVEYSYDTKKWTVTDSRPATEKDMEQWATINGGLPTVNEQDVAEGVGKDLAKIGGITGAAIGLGILGHHQDQKAEKIEVGGQQARLIKNPGRGTIPDNAMTLVGKDGKTYKVWTSPGKGSRVLLATPVENVKEQGVAEGSVKKDMTGQTCEKCKKDKYQERSLRDDWEGTLRCSCGHVVDRWRKYKKKDDEQGVTEGSSDDLVYISVDRVEAFEDWMNSEGLETNVPKTDEGTYVVYDYSDADHTSKMYADDWNEKRGVAISKDPKKK